MPLQFSFGSGLLRTLVSLGFLGCLVAEQTRSAEAATSGSPIVTRAAGLGVCWTPSRFGGRQFANPNHSACQVDSFGFNCSDSVLTGLVETIASDEFEVAVEDQDSIEIFRVDVEQRTFGIDRVATGPEIVPTVARNTRPNISPPLLV